MIATAFAPLPERRRCRTVADHRLGTVQRHGANRSPSRRLPHCGRRHRITAFPNALALPPERRRCSTVPAGTTTRLESACGKRRPHGRTPRHAATRTVARRHTDNPMKGGTA
jgi:hypothetical protein